MSNQRTVPKEKTNEGQPPSKVAKLSQPLRMQPNNPMTLFSSKQSSPPLEVDCVPQGEPEGVLHQKSIARVMHDIEAIRKDPPPGMAILIEEGDVSRVHALIAGAEGTPHEGGFLQFFLRISPDYPIKPPKCRLMTTYGGTPTCLFFLFNNS